MLSLTITDTQNQTAAVFRALAQESKRIEVDLSPWRALQTWLLTEPNGVVIPFAERLAGLIPPLAIRLRRDFSTVLTLIRAHALLHQASRVKDDAGRVVATLDDYAAVRELVADLVAEGVDATVKPEIREVVEAIARLLCEGRDDVSQAELKKALQLDKSAISRRVAGALDGGFLKNLEDRRGRPAKLVLGEPLPPNRDVLPMPALLIGDEGLHGCAVDRGETPPPPPSQSQRPETFQWTARL
jgi:hypothetical protein